ncbi:elongation factor 1-beta [Candidatus Woesearchaeota archaeon]|nr:elongation factor 1-beta [Candidatus Woesearchaeota archaeon]
MSRVVVTLKVMPTSPDVDLDSISEKAVKEVKEFAEIKDDESLRVEQKPVAFGLKEIVIMFAMNESKGDTEKLEKKISLLEGVSSVEVTDVRRVVG